MERILPELRTEKSIFDEFGATQNAGFCSGRCCWTGFCLSSARKNEFLKVLPHCKCRVLFWAVLMERILSELRTEKINF